MQQKEQLFDLVKSLTPHEKGYIRRMAKLHQEGGNNYIRLFDAIDQQEQYDETALRKKFAKETFVQNFSVSKSYLLSAILRHLESYHSSARSEVRSLLNQYDLLKKKGMPALGYKLLRRAHTLCEKNELEYQKEEVLLTLLAHSIQFGGHPEWPGGAEALLVQIRETSRLNTDAGGMRYEMHLLKRQTPGIMRLRAAEDIDYFREKARQLLQYDTSRLTSFDTRYQYYQLLINYFYVCGDTEQGLWCAGELCDWLLVNWSYAATHASGYVTAFYNKALYELVLYKSSLRGSIEVLERLVEKEKLGNADSVLLLRRVKMIEAWETCRCEETLSIAAGTLEFMQEQQAFVNRPGEELNCRMIIACAHFATGQLAAAAKELRTLLRHPFEEKAHSLSAGARILLLIVEFERGDRLGLDSQLRSTYRFLVRKKQLHKVEKCVLAFLRLVLRKTFDRGEMKESFRKLRQEVEIALADRNEESGVRLFDLVSYLDSRISGQSFAEARKTNAAARWMTEL